MEKTFKEKEIERLKFVKKDIREKGLLAWEEYKDIILEYVNKGIDRDIEFFETKRRNNGKN